MNLSATCFLELKADSLGKGETYRGMMLAKTTEYCCMYICLVRKGGALQHDGRRE